MRTPRFVSLLVFTVVLNSLLARSAQADSQLEAKYQTTAKQIVEELRSKNVKTTGVLKFSVRIGAGAFPRNVGSLNTRLAEKLELALVMANPARQADVEKQVGIVRGASDVAATIDGATHLSPDGRMLLFSKSYPLAWRHLGQTTVVPDSLIVGVAQVKADLASMDIEMLLLTKSDLKLSPLAKLTVPTDLEDLMDSGESFTTRGIFDGGSVDEGTTEKIETAAKEEAILVRAETLDKSEPQTSTKHPLSPAGSSPVKFEIWYDNKLQDYEFRDGAAFLPEPREGQDVILVVRRKNSDTIRYGVLVRVNGENTLYREKTPDAQASLWILEPDLEAFSIRGFQITTDEREKFRVLSDADSEKRKFDYGRDTGLISITVFNEQERVIVPPSDDELDLAIQSQSRLPDETKETRGQLGTSLFDQLLAQNDTTRGLIVEGDKEGAEIETVKFTPNLTPVMSASVRYYKADR